MLVSSGCSETFRRTVLRLLLLSGALAAAGNAWASQQGLGFAQKAQQDFDRVDSAPIPSIQDALACSQSHQALLATPLVEQRFLAHYRKGYCELFAGVLLHDSGQFRSAATEFGQSIADWPPRLRAINPQGVRILAAIARLEGGRNAGAGTAELEQAMGAGECPRTPVMNDEFCHAVVDTGRTWLAWLNWQKGQMDEAARWVRPLQDTPWGLWMAGEEAQRQKKHAEGLAAFEKAIKGWSAAEASANPDVITLLGPKPDLGRLSLQVGQTLMDLEKWEAAISSFDATLKSDRNNSQALYLRAQAKEKLGLIEPALTDYGTAAAAARANDDTSWRYGEAYFRRGLLYYRARKYDLAQSEFSTAQSGKPGSVNPNTLTAWRVMAEVAGGACEAADGLATAARAAADDFPKPEATALVMSCKLKLAATPEQLEAVERTYGSTLNPQQSTALRERISSAWADQGVAAEDRKEPARAVEAYRKAVQWNPRNSKARFNLGAIYVDDKRWALAEAEYRGLVEADPKDYEAQFWLGRSILAQQPGPERRLEACQALNRSLAVLDAGKKAAFAKAAAAARCP
jgi:tetratricopeptide (TPR) repeat protein